MESRVGRAVEALGARVLGFLSFLGGAARLLAATAGFLVRDLWRPRSLARRTFATQIVRSGPRALFVVLLVNLFVGMILALMGGKILVVLGFREYVGRLMGVGIVLELGPLLTAIAMTGFIGAAYTAEIASMVVSEEIQALETMAVHPARAVAAPRIMAVLVMLPCLVLLGDVVGIYGGNLIAEHVLEIGANTYWEQVEAQLDAKDVWRGVVKSLCFAAIIALVGCEKGFRARGGTEGVGRTTTSSVVTTIMSIIVADAILNYLLLFRL